MALTLRTLGLLSFTVLGIAVGASSAQAAGFYLQEQSVSGLGSAFSGSTTNIKDASTVWFNPAGMTDLQGRQMNLGVELLIPTAKYKDRGSTLGGPIAGTQGDNPYNPTPLPNIYFATPINDTTWYGLGINTPFGLASDYENSFIARYDSTSTSLQTVNISNVFAHKLNNKLSIGGGLDIQYAHADLSYAVNGGAANDAYATLNGNNIDWGYNLALKYKPLPKTELGATYRSAISNNLQGTLKIEGTSGAIPAFNVGGASAKLKLPDIAAVGVTQSISPVTRVSANATWYGWEKFDAITPIAPGAPIPVGSIPQNYKNTLGFAIGVEHDLNQKWTVRGGYQYDPTPTQDGFRTTRTPDGDRNWIAGGATYRIKDGLSLDMAAAYIHISEEKINLTRNGGTAVINGESEGSVAIVSAALNYKF